MYGPPKNVEGECNARLSIGDDYGDNSCTMRCSLAPGHPGPHTEVWGGAERRSCVTWNHDDTEVEVPEDES
jgi:hypothetical protein